MPKRQPSLAEGGRVLAQNRAPCRWVRRQPAKSPARRSSSAPAGETPGGGRELAEIDVVETRAFGLDAGGKLLELRQALEHGADLIPRSTAPTPESAQSASSPRRARTDGREAERTARTLDAGQALEGCGEIVVIDRPGVPERAFPKACASREGTCSTRLSIALGAMRRPSAAEIMPHGADRSASVTGRRAWGLRSDADAL